MKKEDFSVIRILSSRELKKIYSIGYDGDYWKNWEDKNYKTEKEFFEDEQRRDNLGVVLAFRDKDHNIIGTLRLIRMGYGLTITEKIIKEQEIEYPNLKNSWEGGRLILVKKNRNQKNMLYFISLALKWLIDDRNADYIFAHCPAALGRIYKKFGFKIISKNLNIPHYKRKYVIISESTSKIAKIIENIELNLK
jgi:predicted GNAT family N-acyltransferase